jgi:hypothetical protein
MKFFLSWKHTAESLLSPMRVWRLRGLMPIHRIVGILGITLGMGFADASAEQARTILRNNMLCCIKHRKPLITVRGFQSSSNPLVLVHSSDPRSTACDQRAPNRIGDDQHLSKTKIHVEAHVVTYCPQCAAEYWQCMARDPALSARDIAQIRALVLGRSDFRKPIIRIVPFSARRALVVGGMEDKIGSRFSDISVAKKSGTWSVNFPGELHEVIALGRKN